MYFGSPIHAKEIHSSMFEGCSNPRFMKRIYVLPSSPAARNCANRVARHCPVALHATVHIEWWAMTQSELPRICIPCISGHPSMDTEYIFEASATVLSLWAPISIAVLPCLSSIGQCSFRKTATFHSALLRGRQVQVPKHRAKSTRCGDA